MGVAGGCSTWGNTLFHLGERGVPYGGTKCSTWGNKNMDFMDSHGVPWTKDSGSRRPGGLRFRLQAYDGEIEVEISR